MRRGKNKRRDLRYMKRGNEKAEREEEKERIMRRKEEN